VVRATASLGDTVPMRVLVVEDERRLAAAVKRGLEASGFAVDLAFDGVTGLHMAREGGYDGVVLDIMLPGMSGYTVCMQLRAEENWVPLLFLSAKDGEYDLADGLDIGADDYLVKPFSYVVLAARLRALQGRGPGARPRIPLGPAWFGHGAAHGQGVRPPRVPDAAVRRGRVQGRAALPRLG
jgi:DNA-binding response OmpR family regulator